MEKEPRSFIALKGIINLHFAEFHILFLLYRQLHVSSQRWNILENTVRSLNLEFTRKEISGKEDNLRDTE